MYSKKCDRCGVYYDVQERKTGGVGLYADTASTFPEMIPVDGSKRDLCPECIESLKKWFGKG